MKNNAHRRSAHSLRRERAGLSAPRSPFNRAPGPAALAASPGAGGVWWGLDFNKTQPTNTLHAGAK